jgi:hypothetical protein
MWGWRISVVLFLVAACSSNPSDPGFGNAPDVPTQLVSTSLNGAIALTWDDNAYTADPGNFRNYRVYSTSYNLDAPVAERCGTAWRVEGTNVAPEFLVGALNNGVARCFSVTAVSIDGVESGRSQTRGDTPRPDSRNQVLYAVQVRSDSSGFRFWDDDGDGIVEAGELGRVRPGAAPDIDFVVDRDGTGALFLSPVRAGTGVELYSQTPVADLTSIDFAPCLPAANPQDCATYDPSPIEAAPGFGYVFEMDGGDQLFRYAAVRVSHVGRTFLIVDWAFQTDPGNPELLVAKGAPES